MDTIKIKISKDQLAYHEAGHAVVGAVLGAPPSKVTIRQEGAWGGHTLTNPDRGHHGVQDRALVALAGYVVQVKYAPDSAELAGKGSYQDFKTARWCSERMFSHRLVGERNNKRLEELTEKLIEDHWPVVVEFAETLLTKEVLDQNEIDELLAKHGIT